MGGHPALQARKPHVLTQVPGRVAHVPPGVHRALPPLPLAHRLRAVAIEHCVDRTALIRAEVVRPAECRSAQAFRDLTRVQRSVPHSRPLVDPAADAADAPRARALTGVLSDRLPAEVASHAVPEESPTVHPAPASGRVLHTLAGGRSLSIICLMTPAWLPPGTPPLPVNCPCTSITVPMHRARPSVYRPG